MKGFVLAVDDDENFRTSLRRLLRGAGLKVIPASGALEALEILKKEKIDLVLADLHMIGISGKQLLAQIKESPETQHIPVIMISGVHDVGTVIECLNLGADDYVNKPFDKTLLLTRVHLSLDRKFLVERERAHMEQITKEKLHAESLLKALFPRPVIEELKHTKRIEPRLCEQVSVLFTDIVNFTSYCRNTSPETIHLQLQELVEAFESISNKHKMQKIKTVGDAFMCVGGLWENTEYCGQNAVDCALEMVNKAPQLSAGWEIRAGVHMGPVMAGVVGHQQYFYDVWGDTVNTTARIEASAETGTVLVSNKIRDTLPLSYTVKEKGSFNLKGLGEIPLYKVLSVMKDLESDNFSKLTIN